MFLWGGNKEVSSHSSPAGLQQQCEPGSHYLTMHPGTVKKRRMFPCLPTRQDLIQSHPHLSMHTQTSLIYSRCLHFDSLVMFHYFLK